MMRSMLQRLFGRGKRSPVDVSLPERECSTKRSRWTPEEDARVMAASPTALAERWSGRESELQALARALGRSEQSVRDRRVRLADPGLRDQLASAEAERTERDRRVIEMIRRGASLREAAQRAGVSKTAICRMLKRKAPGLDRSMSRTRGYERRKQLNRVARQLAPRVLDASHAAEGLPLRACRSRRARSPTWWRAKKVKVLTSEAQRYFAHRRPGAVWTLFASKKAPGAVSDEDRARGDRKRQIEERREKRELADRLDHYGD